MSPSAKDNHQAAYQQRLKGRGGLHDRLFARLLAVLSARLGKALHARKQVLFAEALQPGDKNVLEIGMGTGANLEFIAEFDQKHELEILAIEPNPAMREHLARNMAQAGLPASAITLKQGIAEALPVGDATQDVVIMTLVLCSVVSVEAAVAEVYRVLKPGGRYVFLEHVADKPGSWRRWLQEWMNPAWSMMCDHCHLQRETWKVIEGAGFSDIRRYERFELPGERQFFHLLGGLIAGVAVK